MELQQPDWGNGLPTGILGIVAKAGLEGGNEWTKAMRGVCKTWKEEFELSVTKLVIKKDGPPPPPSFSLRFSNLTSLNIGQCIMEGAGLVSLEGLSKVSCLTLGVPGQGKNTSQGENTGQLARNLRLRGLEHVRHFPLTSLDLSGCEKLYSFFMRHHVFDQLQGMPLVRLSLENCRISTTTSLRGLPLTDLNLAGCCIGLRASRIPGECLEALSGMPLTRLNLKDNIFLPLAGVEHLARLPLTDLDLGSCCEDFGTSAMVLLHGLPLRRLVLGLWGGALSDEGLELLRGCSLKRLDVSYSVITDEGLAHLKHGMPLIISLNLSYCQFLTMAGMQHLRGLPLARLNVCFKTWEEGGRESKIGYEAIKVLVGDVLPSDVVITEDPSFVV